MGIETCWEAPEEGFVSLMDQQLEELKNATAEVAQTAAEPVITKKKKKKKKKKQEEEEEEEEYYEEDYREDEEQPIESAPSAPYGQWQTVEKP